jgi:signal transduction histidine kinase
LVALSATLAGAGATVYHLGKRSVTHATLERLGAVARLKAQQIEQWLEENSEHLQLSLSRPYPPSADPRSPGAEEESTHALEEQLRHLEARGAYEGFALRDGRNGNVLFSVGRFDDGHEARTRAAEAASSQRSSLLQLPHAALQDAHLLSMFVPLPAEQARPWTAVVQASVDLQHALAPLIERWQGTDATAQTLLVKPNAQQLEVLLRSSGTAVAPATASASSFASEVASQAPSGGPVTTEDDRGVPVLAYVTPVRGTPWMLVTKVDLSEACSALDSLAVLSAGLGVLMLMGCAWWWVEHQRDLARRIQHHVERAELGDRVLALSRRVVQAQEEERKRISVDLHDSAGANLAAVQLHLAAIEKHLRSAPSQAHELMRETHDLVSETILGIREACGELRPAVLDRMGLVAALKSYAFDFARRTGVDVRFSADVVDKPVPADQASALYRIAQEALHNCAAHAAARHIDIALHSGEHGLRFSIADDGTGFDPAALRGHDGKRGLGLVSMRERAELFGGRLSLDTRPGHGTRVVVEMPRPGLPVTAEADGA